MKFPSTIIALFFLFLVACQPDQNQISLSGEWDFRIDSLDIGITNGWFRESFVEEVNLPGSMAENEKGMPVDTETVWTGQIVDQSWYTSDRYAKFRKPGNIKIPFWLQPKFHYVGPAWYQKVVTIPKNWTDKRIDLHLERSHWESKVWIDGQMIGTQNSLATPHRYNLTPFIKPGQHLVTIRVDNRMIVDVGENAHSVSDHTQTNWNGLVGSLEIRKRSPVHFGLVKLFPDVDGKSLKIIGVIENQTNDTVSAVLEATIRMVSKVEHHESKPGQPQWQTGAITGLPLKIQKTQAPGKEVIEITCSLGDDCKFWDEFSPNLYQLQLDLNVAQLHDSDQVTELFGMRDFKVEGTRFAVNGRSIFLRGTLECAIFPKTGYPPTDVDEWRRILTVIKNHGLNHMRFHSWCPPEAAFIAADLEGIYLQVECGAWTTVGTGSAFDSWIFAESDRIVNAYGNHPSFCMMVYGNEPGGANQVSFLEEFVSYWKEKDTRRVYTSGAGWPPIPSMDYYNNAYPRIQGWGEGLKSIINAQPPSTSYDWALRNAKIFPDNPVVSHEIGQWCVYPNFKEIPKYDGVLKALNFEIFQETLENNHLGHLADSFLLASGKLQALCYKADIEAALRTPGMAGFQLLDLHDFPGQGTALVGVLDPFWEEKGYITADEYSKFCNSVVPLARIPRMVLTNHDTLSVDVEIANYGPSDLQDLPGILTISTTSGDKIKEATFRSGHLPTGRNTKVYQLKESLRTISQPTHLILTVSIGNHQNHWDLWVYPSSDQKSRPDNIPVFTSITPELQNIIDHGGSAILSLGPDGVAPDKGGAIALGFSSIFWNTAWTRKQAPHTLGVLCDPDHPALADFPTEYHSNWQWWDIVSYAKPLIMDELDPNSNPVVRIIDDWFENRRLALIMEAKVGKAKLIISGTDLVNYLDQRPATGQLLRSLKQYISGTAFNPVYSMSPEQLAGFVK